MWWWCGGGGVKTAVSWHAHTTSAAAHTSSSATVQERRVGNIAMLCKKTPAHTPAHRTPPTAHPTPTPHTAHRTRTPTHTRTHAHTHTNTVPVSRTHTHTRPHTPPTPSPLGVRHGPVIELVGVGHSQQRQQGHAHDGGGLHGERWEVGWGRCGGEKGECGGVDTATVVPQPTRGGTSWQ